MRTRAVAQHRACGQRRKSTARSRFQPQPGRARSGFRGQDLPTRSWLDGAKESNGCGEDFERRGWKERTKERPARKSGRRQAAKEGERRGSEWVGIFRCQRWPNEPVRPGCLRSPHGDADRVLDQRSVTNRFTMATACATRRSPVATIRTLRISITTFNLQIHRKCSTDWWGASRRRVL